MVQYTLVRYKTRQENSRTCSFHFLIGRAVIKINLNTKGYFTVLLHITVTHRTV